MGLIPAGTANLLARTLDLPLGELSAIEVALGGHIRRIDLVRITVDDRQALGRLPVRMTVQLDGHRPVRRDAMLCVIGNVGKLRGNLALIPGASPEDGLLDLYIASPHRFHHWVKLALRLMTRRAKKDDQVDQRTGKKVRIRIHGNDNYQLDGDVVGQSTT